MKITQTTIERSLYLLLILMFLINIAIGYEVVRVQTKQNQNHQYTNQTLTNVQNEMICIGEFFLQLNRANITIANLPACNSIVKKVK